MSLSSGVRLGSYEVVAPLGAGGMGEVYRAKDTKLGRAVAIKVLPEAFLTDPDRIARFEREAKLLASLNHPHIAALFGMEEADGRHFLVMELVEGETLADRLRRGPIPVEPALAIARQIVDALESAHDANVVHRDLKPANVKITPDEKVKVLDFGLAKAVEVERAGGNLTHSPTLSLMATQAGMVLGTAAYMSPEQAKGFPADQRSDIFSFGVVLYETLTGRQPFHGETAPDILASVLVREADLTVLPPNLSPRLVEVVRRCLEKNPKKRWHAAGDLRVELEGIAAAPHSTPLVAAAAAPRPLWRRAIPVVGAAIVCSALTGAAVWTFKPSTPAVVARFGFALGEGQQLTNAGRPVIAISPDGTKIVYVANQRLYLRPMADSEARPIAGSEDRAGVLNPAFSPDGQSLVFQSSADQALKRIAVSGGAPVTICQAATPFGVNWGSDGIVFGQGNAGVLRVSSNGGQPEVLAKVEPDELAHGPQVLPGGDVVLFTLAKGSASDRWEKAQIVAHSLRSGQRKTLVSGGSDARYLPTGHLVYALGGVMFAVPFDPDRLEVRGSSVPVIEGVRRATGASTGAMQAAFAANGSLVYLPGPTSTLATERTLVFLDRQGGVQALKLPPRPYTTPRVSRDGKRLAYATDDGKESNIWVYELSGANAARRLTFGGQNRAPVWSADNEYIVFQSDREGDLGMFRQRADGTAPAERLTKAEAGTAHTPESVSLDGKWLSFGVRDTQRSTLWILSLRDRKATAFASVQSPAPINSMFSPDSRWIAYTSAEGTRPAVLVQPFPATGMKQQISKEETGHHPLWSSDGKQLFYVPSPSEFLGVNVSTQPVFTFSDPFSLQKGGVAVGNPGIVRNHDIMPDGKRFIGIAAGAIAAAQPTTTVQVVLNWFEELRARAPVR